MLSLVFCMTVFKDGGKEEKKKDPTSSSVKCYFVRMQSCCSADESANYILSNRTVSEARALFMHAHLLPSLDKYMARYELEFLRKYYHHLDLLSIFLCSPAVPFKIDLMQCTNLRHSGSLSFCQRPSNSALTWQL